MSYQVINSEIVAWANNYHGEKFMAVLCDPPYNLESISKRFGKPGSAPAQEGKDGAFKRASAGFMGMSWDSDSAFQPETWAAIAKCLHPGGFIIAFGGARTYHRMAVAMEDAGLILHPSIFLWGYGQGFPKATRIDTQIDRDAGKEQPVVGVFDPRGTYDGKTGVSNAFNKNWREAEGRSDVRDNSKILVKEPVTDLAKAWAGHRYGLQSTKPAGEPLLIARKPFGNTELVQALIEIQLINEVLLWQFLSAPDAENLITQTHQCLRVAVDSFAHGHAGLWELLGLATFAERNIESGQAELTLRDFVAGPVMTKEEMLRLVQTIPIGKVGDGYVEMDTSSLTLTANKFSNIAILWNSILEEVLAQTSRFTIETETHLTIELKILRSSLSRVISVNTTPNSETQANGLLSNVTSVENLLRGMIAQLSILSTTSVAGNASGIIADYLDGAVEGSRKAEITPILVAQKPYEGRPVDNIVSTGAGALNIDATRVGTDENLNGGAYAKEGARRDDGWRYQRGGAGDFSQPTGRWTPNVALVHSPGCRMVGEKIVPGRTINQFTDGAKPFGGGAGHPYESQQMPDETVEVWDCDESCAIRRLNLQSGELTSGTGAVKHATAAGYQGKDYGAESRPEGTPNVEYGDTGGAARFFPNFDWNAEAEEAIALADPFRYQAKVSKKEANAGLEPVGGGNGVGTDNPHPT